MHVEVRTPNERSRVSDSVTTSNLRLRSNLRLHSNLFPITDPFRERLPGQISGAGALRKYLDRAAANVPFEMAARERLCPWQQAQLAYELGCEDCHAIPEGRIRTANGPRIEFRCPRGACDRRRSFARIINIDVALLERILQRFGPDFSAIVQKALYAYAAKVGVGQSLESRDVQMPVRVTPTQYYLFQFETLLTLSRIVHACLLAFEENENA
jgi:hypothetical protein